MPLVEHLRELRRRILISIAAVFVGALIAWVYYGPLFAWLREPFDQVVADAAKQGRNVELVLAGVADPFTLQLQISAAAGVVLSAPIWLFQLWRFLMPGLQKRERMWAYIFMGSATPLFLAGAALALWVLPTGLQILFGFTPEGVANFIQVNRYISFMIRMVLVFGLGFLLPFVIVMLNFARVLTGKRVLSWWRAMVVAVFVFAAIATPTGDPVNLLLLAGPMTLLMVLAIGIALLNDRRRIRKGIAPGSAWASLSDDEASPL